jgi:hypothetical protein
MQTTTRISGRRTIVRLAALGATVGALVGGWMTLPALVGAWIALPDLATEALLGTLKFMAIAVGIGAGLGAAAGAAVMRGPRRWFWIGVTAWLVVTIPLALLIRDVRAAAVLLIPGVVLAVAFGLRVLIEMALDGWDTRRAGR